MAILTTRHHVNRALRFFNVADKYVGIGRTTAWPDENNPPVPDPTQVTLEEPIGYKPLSDIKLLVPDAGGSFVWAGQNWREVLEADAKTEGAFYVYVESRLEYDELPLTAFRQVGVFSALVKAAGAGAGALLPAEVTDPGDMEFLDNRQLESRVIDKVNTIGMVIRF